MLRKTMMTSHFNSMISTTLKKYLILLSGLVACIGLSAQEKEVEVGMKCIVETAIIDSVDCSNEYFIKDVYVDYCVYTDDITLSIYGDVPKVTGNITPTDSAIETEIDGIAYTLYKFIWNTTDERYKGSEVTYAFSWYNTPHRFELELKTTQGITEVYKGRLYTGYGTSVENQQDSGETE